MKLAKKCKRQKNVEKFVLGKIISLRLFFFRGCLVISVFIVDKNSASNLLDQDKIKMSKSILKCLFVFCTQHTDKSSLSGLFWSPLSLHTN